MPKTKLKIRLDEILPINLVQLRISDIIYEFDDEINDIIDALNKLNKHKIEGIDLNSNQLVLMKKKLQIRIRNFILQSKEFLEVATEDRAIETKDTDLLKSIQKLKISLQTINTLRKQLGL